MPTLQHEPNEIEEIFGDGNGSTQRNRAECKDCDWKYEGSRGEIVQSRAEAHRFVHESHTVELLVDILGIPIKTLDDEWERRN